MKSALNPHVFIAGLLCNWAEAIRHPETARAVLCPRSAFDDPFLVVLVRELLLANGDWRAAAQGARQRGQPESRVAAFVKWAERKTARPVRGFLPWNGGAA